ncbi:hypothetical protein Hanom_Chr02g00112811 [Helianthus anomalus]
MYIFCNFSFYFIWSALCLGLGCALILEWSSVWAQLLRFRCGGFYTVEGPLGMGFKQQLLVMTRAHIISWGHGFLRLLKAQTWPDCPTKRTRVWDFRKWFIFKRRPNTGFLL